MRHGIGSSLLPCIMLASGRLGIAWRLRYFPPRIGWNSRSMGRIVRQRRSGTRAMIARCALVVSIFGWFWIAGPSRAAAVELTEPLAALYTTVSILPPSAASMTVCYGFVCRRREMLDFTLADRRTLVKILASGRN